MRDVKTRAVMRRNGGIDIHYNSLTAGLGSFALFPRKSGNKGHPYCTGFTARFPAEPPFNCFFCASTSQEFRVGSLGKKKRHFERVWRAFSTTFSLLSG